MADYQCSSCEKVFNIYYTFPPTVILCGECKGRIETEERERTDLVLSKTSRGRAILRTSKKESLKSMIARRERESELDPTGTGDSNF